MFKGFQQKIVGGKTSSIRDFPWLVMVGAVEDGEVEQYNCGGSLISDDIVLTAAHCMHPRWMYPELYDA